MIITIDKKLNKTIVDEKTTRKYYGKIAPVIPVVISILKACPTLNDVPNVPPTRRHKLTGDYSNCWALDLSPTYRMIIRPNIMDNDLSKINEITIIAIKDYH